MTDTAPLTNDELLALWERGRRIAQVCCSHSLRLLRRGHGGFYDADDLWQDLFLDFLALARHWAGCNGPRQAEELMAAWRQRLWGGGVRLLRRRPQRLWRGCERAIDLCDVDPAEDDGARAPGMEALPAAVREALTDNAGPEDAWRAAGDSVEVEARLWRLSPTARQALYLSAGAGLSGMEVARCLRLESPGQVYEHVRTARASLQSGCGADTPQRAMRRVTSHRGERRTRA